MEVFDTLVGIILYGVFLLMRAVFRQMQSGRYVQPSELRTLFPSPEPGESSGCEEDEFDFSKARY